MLKSDEYLCQREVEENEERLRREWLMSSLEGSEQVTASTLTRPEQIHGTFGGVSRK